MPRRNVTRLLFTFFNFSGFRIFLCFFARVVFIAKLLFFDVFQLGASFLFFDDGEICLATPDPGSCLWIAGFHCHNIIKTIQQINSRITEIKEDEYSNSLTKVQVCAMFRAGDIRINVLLKFIRLCMETPCLCPSQGHKYGGRKLTKTYVIEFCYKKPVVVFWGLINIYVSTYSLTRTVQIAKSQRISHFFNLRDSILDLNFNIVSRKSLEIQPCFISRRKTLSNWKFVKRKVFSCSNS